MSKCCQPAVFGNWPCPADRPKWLKRDAKADGVERPWALYVTEPLSGYWNPGATAMTSPTCPPDPVTGAVRFYSAFHKRCIDQRTPSPTWSPVYGSDPAGPFFVDSSFAPITDSRYYVPQIPYY